MITKDSFILGKGYSWFSARLFSVDNLSSVNRNTVRLLISGVLHPWILTVPENSFGTVLDSPSPNYVPKNKTCFIVASAVFTNRVRNTNIFMTKI